METLWLLSWLLVFFVLAICFTALFSIPAAGEPAGVAVAASFGWILAGVVSVLLFQVAIPYFFGVEPPRVRVSVMPCEPALYQNDERFAAREHLFEEERNWRLDRCPY